MDRNIALLKSKLIAFVRYITKKCFFIKKKKKNTKVCVINEL